jgi:hypothetical protein
VRFFVAAAAGALPLLPPPIAATTLDAVLAGATGCTIAGTAGDDVLRGRRRT